MKALAILSIITLAIGFTKVYEAIDRNTAQLEKNYPKFEVFIKDQGRSVFCDPQCNIIYIK